MKAFKSAALIETVITKYRTIDSEKWFSPLNLYRTKTISKIYNIANEELKVKQKPTEKDTRFIMAVINFIKNLRPELRLPCYFVYGNNYDFPTCTEYEELERTSNPTISICRGKLFLKSRLKKCPDFRDNIIRETKKHADAYLTYVPGIKL